MPRLLLFLTALVASTATAAYPEPAPLSSTTKADCKTKQSTLATSSVKISASSIASISANTRDAVYSQPPAYDSTGAASVSASISSVKPSSTASGSSVKPSSIASSGTTVKPSGTASGTAVKPSGTASSSIVQPSGTASSSLAASSGTASSASPSSSATSTTYAVTSVPGCPLITIPTTTSTSRTTIYDWTTTYWYSRYSYTTFTQTYEETVYTSTSTQYVRTITRTSLVVPTASTTVTVPTQPGFTPLLCEPAYYATEATKTETYYQPWAVSSTDTIAPIVTLTTVDPFVNGTVTAVTPRTVTGTFYETVTTTRATSPTQTVYDACQANNISPKLPDGGNAFLISQVYDSQTNTQNSTGERVLALDAIDCCSLCHGNSTCTATTWMGSFINVGEKACALFIKNVEQDTCNPRFVGAYPASEGDISGVWHVMSNGACGQYAIR